MYNVCVLLSNDFWCVLDGMVMVSFEVSTLVLEEGDGTTVCIEATNDFERDIVVDVLSVRSSAEGWFSRQTDFVDLEHFLPQTQVTTTELIRSWCSPRL